MNVSGEPAASVVLISGEQRVDLGEVGNGAVEQVELLAGHPLQIEYSFGTRRVSHASIGPSSSFPGLSPQARHLKFGRIPGIL